MNQILIEYRSYLIALFIAMIPVYFAVYLHNRNRFNAAADKFRGVVLSNLEGIVPVNGFWRQDIYPRINNTVPIIKRAALEFRPAVPFYRKRGFDIAVMEYCNQGENVNWHQAAADAIYGDDTEKTQKEIFSECVFKLLSFTE